MGLGSRMRCGDRAAVLRHKSRASRHDSKKLSANVTSVSGYYTSRRARFLDSSSLPSGNELHIRDGKAAVFEENPTILMVVGNPIGTISAKHVRENP